jgi:hypothetical protein
LLGNDELLKIRLGGKGTSSVTCGGEEREKNVPAITQKLQNAEADVKAAKSGL